MANGALVTITTEECSFTQAYFFNRRISPNGAVIGMSGTTSRTVTISTVIYRGDKTEVQSAISTAQGAGKKTVIRKIDGPWWEGTATLTTYGTWTTTMDGSNSNS